MGSQPPTSSDEERTLNAEVKTLKKRLIEVEGERDALLEENAQLKVVNAQLENGDRKLKGPTRGV